MKTETAPNPASTTPTDDGAGVVSVAICSHEQEWDDERFAHYVQFVTVGGQRIAAYGTRLCGSRWSGRPIEDLDSKRTKPMCPICEALFNANAKA